MTATPNPPAAESPPLRTDVVIVGAGPCGLFQVFELGLLGIKAHVRDSLKAPGGQCTELYPDKPIYDIPALPVCGAQELVDRLMQQIKPFDPQFHLGEEVLEVAPQPDRRFRVATSAGTVFDAGAIVIAAGVGSFQPRRIGVPGSEAFEGTQIHYRVRSAADYRGQHLLIFGGGDSALDWAIDFAPTAASLTLVHRRAEFRAAPASVAKMRELEAQGRLQFIEGLAESLILEGDRLAGIQVKGADGVLHPVAADHVFAFFGLHPKLGPVAEWGLNLHENLIPVDTEKFETSVEGIFAIGDINTYPGKLKLILSGFHEAALMAQKVFKLKNPGERLMFQYTTSSSNLQKKLGVS